MDAATFIDAAMLALAAAAIMAISARIVADRRWERELVARNLARYNPTTGALEWNDEKAKSEGQE